jgi:hypothetical protein
VTSVPPSAGVKVHVIVMVPECRVLRVEHRALDDALGWNELDERSLDDVFIFVRLASRAMARWGERQPKAIGAAGAWLEDLEAARRSSWRKPAHERLRIDEGAIDLVCGCPDELRSSVGSLHPVQHSGSARDLLRCSRCMGTCRTMPPCHVERLATVAQRQLVTTACDQRRPRPRNLPTRAGARQERQSANTSRSGYACP